MFIVIMFAILNVYHSFTSFYYCYYYCRQNIQNEFIILWCAIDIFLLLLLLLLLISEFLQKWLHSLYKDKWICYIEKATHLALVWVHWLLRLPPWNYCTPWFSSFNIYYNCAVVVTVVVTVVVRFLVLTRVVPRVLILSAIPRNLRELTQVFFSRCYGFMAY